jgi:hypothetical protein
MPIRVRRRLSRGEEAEYRRCLQEMHNEGVDVEVPDDSPEHLTALDIMVVGGLASLIFNLPSGRAGYAIWLRLVARRCGLILPEPCEITTKFDDQIVFECFDSGGPISRLGQCSYLQQEVLNDRFPLRFHRGHLIEGVILATGLKPIPKEYVQGMAMPFQLTVWDQFGNEITVESRLSVDRSTAPRPRMVRNQSALCESAKIPETREPFGRKDPGVPAGLRATPIGVAR